MTFASTGDGRNGKPDPVVDAYLYRPEAAGARPALVFLHGCAGLVGASGQVKPRETDWAERMTGLGYVVLALDSFSTRHQGPECAPNAPHAVNVWFDRVHDANAALRYLRQQSFVQPGRSASSAGLRGVVQRCGDFWLCPPAGISRSCGILSRRM